MIGNDITEKNVKRDDRGKIIIKNNCITSRKSKNGYWCYTDKKAKPTVIIAIKTLYQKTQYLIKIKHLGGKTRSCSSSSSSSSTQFRSFKFIEYFGWDGPHQGQFLKGYSSGYNKKDTKYIDTLEKAKQISESLGNKSGGITQEVNKKYTIRKGSILGKGRVSEVLIVKTQKAQSKKDASNKKVKTKKST